MLSGSAEERMVTRSMTRKAKKVEEVVQSAKKRFKRGSAAERSPSRSQKKRKKGSDKGSKKKREKISVMETPTAKRLQATLGSSKKKETEVVLGLVGTYGAVLLETQVGPQNSKYEKEIIDSTVRLWESISLEKEQNTDGTEWTVFPGLRELSGIIPPAADEPETVVSDEEVNQFYKRVELLLKSHYPSERRTPLDHVIAQFILGHPEHTSTIVSPIVDMLVSHKQPVPLHKRRPASPGSAVAVAQHFQDTPSKKKGEEEEEEEEEKEEKEKEGKGSGVETRGGTEDVGVPQQKDVVMHAASSSQSSPATSEMVSEEEEMELDDSSDSPSAAAKREQEAQRLALSPLRTTTSAITPPFTLGEGTSGWGTARLLYLARANKEQQNTLFSQVPLEVVHLISKYATESRGRMRSSASDKAGITKAKKDSSSPASCETGETRVETGGTDSELLSLPKPYSPPSSPRRYTAKVQRADSPQRALASGSLPPRRRLRFRLKAAPFYALQRIFRGHMTADPGGDTSQEKKQYERKKQQQQAESSALGSKTDTTKKTKEREKKKKKKGERGAPMGYSAASVNASARARKHDYKTTYQAKSRKAKVCRRELLRYLGERHMEYIGNLMDHRGGLARGKATHLGTWMAECLVASEERSTFFREYLSKLDQSTSSYSGQREAGVIAACLEDIILKSEHYVVLSKAVVSCVLSYLKQRANKMNASHVRQFLSPFAPFFQVFFTERPTVHTHTLLRSILAQEEDSFKQCLPVQVNRPGSALAYLAESHTMFQIFSFLLEGSVFKYDVRNRNAAVLAKKSWAKSRNKRRSVSPKKRKTRTAAATDSTRSSDAQRKIAQNGPLRATGDQRTAASSTFSLSPRRSAKTTDARKDHKSRSLSSVSKGRRWFVVHLLQPILQEIDSRIGAGERRKTEVVVAQQNKPAPGEQVSQLSTGTSPAEVLLYLVFLTPEWTSVVFRQDQESAVVLSRRLTHLGGSHTGGNSTTSSEHQQQAKGNTAGNFISALQEYGEATQRGVLDLWRLAWENEWRLGRIFWPEMASLFSVYPILTPEMKEITTKTFKIFLRRCVVGYPPPGGEPMEIQKQMGEEEETKRGGGKTDQSTEVHKLQTSSLPPLLRSIIQFMLYNATALRYPLCLLIATLSAAQATNRAARTAAAQGAQASVLVLSAREGRECERALVQGIANLAADTSWAPPLVRVKLARDTDQESSRLVLLDDSTSAPQQGHSVGCANTITSSDTYVPGGSTFPSEVHTNKDVALFTLCQLLLEPLQHSSGSYDIGDGERQRQRDYAREDKQTQREEGEGQKRLTAEFVRSVLSHPHSQSALCSFLHSRSPHTRTACLQLLTVLHVQYPLMGANDPNAFPQPDKSCEWTHAAESFWRGRSSRVLLELITDRNDAVASAALSYASQLIYAINADNSIMPEEVLPPGKRVNCTESLHMLQEDVWAGLVSMASHHLMALYLQVTEEPNKDVVERVLSVIEGLFLYSSGEQTHQCNKISTQPEETRCLSSSSMQREAHYRKCSSSRLPQGALMVLLHTHKRFCGGREDSFIPTAILHKAVESPQTQTESVQLLQYQLLSSCMSDPRKDISRDLVHQTIPSVLYGALSAHPGVQQVCCFILRKLWTKGGPELQHLVTRLASVQFGAAETTQDYTFLVHLLDQINSASG